MGFAQWKHHRPKNITKREKIAQMCLHHSNYDGTQSIAKHWWLKLSDFHKPTPSYPFTIRKMLFFLQISVEVKYLPVCTLFAILFWQTRCSWWRYLSLKQNNLRSTITVEFIYYLSSPIISNLNWKYLNIVVMEKKKFHHMPPWSHIGFFCIPRFSSKYFQKQLSVHFEPLIVLLSNFLFPPKTSPLPNVDLCSVQSSPNLCWWSSLSSGWNCFQFDLGLSCRVLLQTWAKKDSQFKKEKRTWPGLLHKHRSSKGRCL